MSLKKSNRLHLNVISFLKKSISAICYVMMVNEFLKYFVVIILG